MPWFLIFCLSFLFSETFALPTNHQIEVQIKETNLAFGKPFEIRYHFQKSEKIISFEGASQSFGENSLDIRFIRLSNNVLTLSVTPYELSNRVNMPALRIKSLKDGKTNLFLTYSFPLNILSLPTQSVKRAEPIEEIFPIYDFYPLVIAWILLSLVAFSVFRFLKKVKEKSDPTMEEEIDPFEEARKALKALDTKNAQKQYKTYFIKLSEIIRRFIEKSFQIPALEMASSEIIQNFQDLQNEEKASEEMVEMVRYVLRICDRVKYAKYVPNQEQIELTRKEILQFVETVYSSQKETIEKEDQDAI